MGLLILLGMLVAMICYILFDIDLAPGPSVEPSKKDTHNAERISSPLLDRPPQSAERTTAQLVGSGLVYFVFWFFGAPMLFVLLFLVSQGSEVPEIFFAGIIVGIFGFMAHTIWIIADGFEASTSTDKPATPSKMVDAQPSQSNRIPCPMCAELILPEAKICRFCKSEIRKD